MPFYELGTLGDWLFGRERLNEENLSAPPLPRSRMQRTVQQKPWKIQHVLQQVLQGVAFLHQNHIIHRDIKCVQSCVHSSSQLTPPLPSPPRLENILMRSETQPIITDFDISKDNSQTRKTSLSRSPGTAEYMAPELLGAEPSEATAASDMWAFGVVMMKVTIYLMLICDWAIVVFSHAMIVVVLLLSHLLPQAFFPQSPCVLLPGKEHVAVPSHDSLPLRNLLQSLLSADPSKRLSAEEALVHPFFSTSMVEELQSSGQLLETDRCVINIVFVFCFISSLTWFLFLPFLLQEIGCVPQVLEQPQAGAWLVRLREGGAGACRLTTQHRRLGLVRL